MIEYNIDDKNRAAIGYLRSVKRKVMERISQFEGYENVDATTAILLDNELRLISELGTSVDIAGYTDSAFPIVSNIYPSMISRELVSIQPQHLPRGQVFFYDPKVETSAGTGVYASLHTIHTGNSAYDVSKGLSTVVQEAKSAVTYTQYTSGNNIVLPYSGGVDGLSSLQVMLDVDRTGFSGINGIVTASSTLATTSPLFVFDDKIGSGTWADNMVRSGWLQYQFTAFTPTINSYSIRTYAAGLPNTVKLSGSADGSSWTELNVNSGLSLLASRRYVFPLTASSSYDYYRIYVSGGVPATFVSEAELLGPEKMNFVINPQTWASSFFNGMNISIKATNDWLSNTVDLEWSAATRSAYTQYNIYESLEGVSGVQQVQLTITGAPVTVSSKQLKTAWTSEMEEELLPMFNMDMQQTFIKMMADEIAAEIDREIIRDLINIAPYETSWNYVQTATTTMTDGTIIPPDISSGTHTQYQWNQTLLTQINKISGLIKKNNFNRDANWIVCSTHVGSVIEDMPEFYSFNLIDQTMDIKVTGRLSGKYNVFVDPYLPKDVCLIGYKGSDEYDAGYIYAPYRVMVPTEKIHDPDELFTWKLGLMNRAGKYIATNKKYGLIRCEFPSVYEVINGE